MTVLIKQRVRASINFAGRTFNTPDIVSFSVNRSRGQMSAQFSVSVKVPYSDLSTMSAAPESIITITAGFEGALKPVFKGIIRKCSFSPIRQDASKVMMNLSGNDFLSVLEGQKITRRTVNYKDGDGPPERWGVVNSVVKHNTPVRKKLHVQPVDQGPVALPYDGNTHMTLIDPRHSNLYEASPDKTVPAPDKSLEIGIVPEEE
jgi:hypothetical protein